MDFKKYLPQYLIIKNVLSIDGYTIYKYILVKSNELNFSQIKYQDVQSWHPLIIKDGKNFYYIKGLSQTNYSIASFCINNETYDSSFTKSILENYFNKNSFEI